MTYRHHSLVIQRTARYVTNGQPDANVREVWFLCHGYGQLAEEFLRYTETLNDGTRYLVAPEGLSRFYREGTRGRIGASWMTKEDRESEISDYVKYLDAVYAEVFQHIDRDKVKVSVLGFSQGVHTAARWITAGELVHADSLVVWGSPIPKELHGREGFRRLRAVDLFVAYGNQDDYIPLQLVEEQRRQLAAHGITATEFQFNGGHRLDKATLRKIADR
ncbi:MAG: phospholipase [Gemmatimonadota bacterium]|nr:phospholipase [Gemmatimonadota bacterium]